VTKNASAVEKLEAPSQRRYTYEQLVAELPETNQPCELWDGELSMSPATSVYHQEIVLRFSHRLYDWVSKRNLGKVVIN
jgi:Uma2 family endonuclease